MNEREELHAKFFNDEIEVIKDLDDQALLLRLQELESIDFEVKSRKSAINAENRKRKANKTENQRSWMVTPNNSIEVGDAINNVKIRKARMSKGDKMYEGLVNTLGKEQADKIMSGVAKFQSNGSQTTSTSRTLVQKATRSEIEIEFPVSLTEPDEIMPDITPIRITSKEDDDFLANLLN